MIKSKYQKTLFFFRNLKYLKNSKSDDGSVYIRYLDLRITKVIKKKIEI